MAAIARVPAEPPRGLADAPTAWLRRSGWLRRSSGSPFGNEGHFAGPPLACPAMSAFLGLVLRESREDVLISKCNFGEEGPQRTCTRRHRPRNPNRTPENAQDESLLGARS